MSDKLVSVIMGIYNCADTLEKAVECIMSQTYSNLELIMCDDGSGDQTYQKAVELAKKDGRIRVLKNEKNLTLAPTLNICLKEAKGEYIARMDGDDTCSPDRFEKEITFLESHPEYSFCSCNMNLANENGVYRTIEYIEKPTLTDLIKTSQFCHAAVMIRTEALKKVGGYREESEYKGVEDYDLWVRLYENGEKGYNLNEALYTMFDSSAAGKRRSLNRRINESRIKYHACKSAKVGYLRYFECVTPIIKWLVPSFIYKNAHRGKK